MKRHTLKVCSIIRMLISTLQFTTYFFLCCNVFKTVVVNVSFRAGWCDCCMQCLVLFCKVLNVESIRHCAHTLILFHSLCPVLFCPLTHEVRWSYQFLFRWSPLMTVRGVWITCVDWNTARKIRTLLEFCVQVTGSSQNSDLWFLNLSFVRAVSRTLVLEFLSCRASPQESGVLTNACWGVWRAAKHFRPKSDLPQNLNGLSCHFLDKTKVWPVDSWKRWSTHYIKTAGND